MESFLDALEPIWVPHAGQRELLTNQSPIRVLACGRRWGKTDACAVQTLFALTQEHPTQHLILAPTADQASILFERLLKLADDFTELTEAGVSLKVKRSPYPHLRFGRHRVMARSGHIPRSLRGHEATHIVVDEAAYLPEALITEVAMPMLATTEGRLTLISTPRGKDHFWRFFEMGQAGENGVWSRRSPSDESPYVSESFLNVQKELISERAFRIEYEAEFLDSSGRVFRSESINAALVPRFDECTDGPFCIGIGYGDAPEDAKNPDSEGLALAQRTIEDGMRVLGAGDYWGYNQHCVEAKSDARDAGQVFRYLRGPMQGRVLDLTYTDASELYHQPRPTWVAAALMEWELEG